MRLNEFEAFKDMARKFLEKYALENLGGYRVWHYQHPEQILIKRIGSPRKMNGLQHYDVLLYIGED